MIILFTRHAKLLAKLEKIPPMAANRYWGLSRSNISMRSWSSERGSSSTSADGKVITPSTQEEMGVDEPAKNMTAGPIRRLIQRYSITEQQHRIELSQRLFRSVQRQATDRKWHTHCRVDVAFRPRHALLTLHIWLVHRRLLLAIKPPNGLDNVEGINSLSRSAAVLLQEEFFETFWHDTKLRIRYEKVQELMVEKSLKDVQNYTFQHFMALDHAIDNNNEQLFDNPRIREDLGLALWTHVYRSNDEIQDEVVDCLADHVLQQFHNIVYLLPQKYFDEGRIKWIECPSDVISSIAGVVDDSTGALRERLGEKLPPHWFTNLTEAGEVYYWNEQTRTSSWERPSS